MSCAIARSLVVVSLLTAPVAHAGTVHGQIRLPIDQGEAPDGLWRLDNGLLPVLPKTADARTDCFVLVVPKVPPKSRKPATVSAELRGLKLVPSLIVATTGDTVEVRNEDRVPHALFADDLLPEKTIAAGSVRSELVQRPGIYTIHDGELPHVRGWLVVVDGGIVARPDDRGAWRAELPDGHYTAKLFYRGAFVGEHPFDVSARPAEVDLTATGEHP